MEIQIAAIYASVLLELFPMERILPSVFTDFFDNLCPFDGLNLVVVNHFWMNLVKPYIAILSFAMTRMRVNHVSLTIKDWQNIWQQCGELAESHQLSVGVWAYSINMDFPESVITRCGPVTFTSEVRKGILQDFFDLVLPSNLKVTYVLLLSVNKEVDDETENETTERFINSSYLINCLTVLSNGQFALISGYFDSLGWLRVRFTRDRKSFIAGCTVSKALGWKTSLYTGTNGFLSLCFDNSLFYYWFESSYKYYYWTSFLSTQHSDVANDSERHVEPGANLKIFELDADRLAQLLSNHWFKI